MSVLPGRRLSELEFVELPIGTEIYGNKDGLPVRVAIGGPNGTATLDAGGKQPLAESPAALAAMLSLNADVKDRATALALAVDATRNALRVAGYAAPGDGGGALYRRVGVEPAHVGKFQSADGAWWEIAEPKLRPEMFGGFGNVAAVDDYPAILAGHDVSVALKVPFHFGEKNYYLGSRFDINPAAMITSDRRARLFPRTGSGLTDGVRLLPGNVTGKLELPGFTSFPGVALDVRCALGVVRVPQFLSCGTAVKFSAVGGSNVLDTIVEVLAAISGCTTGVEFTADNAARVIQGCGLNFNFITNTMNPIVVSGTPCFNDGMWARGEAIDMTAAQAAGTVLANTNGGTVPRFTLEVRSWFGGAGFSTAPYAKVTSGIFAEAVLNLCTALPLGLNNINVDSLRSSSVKTRGMNATAYAASDVSGIANFNAGVATPFTSFRVAAVSTTNWAVGAVKDFFFYSPWADRFYHPWMVTPRAMPGATAIETIIDENNTATGQVRVRCRNNSAAIINAGAIVEFTALRL